MEKGKPRIECQVRRCSRVSVSGKNFYLNRRKTLRMDYAKAKSYIVKKLNLELSSDLYYHGFHHTVDVLNATKKIIEFEGIKGEDAELLKTAALFHDCGFLRQYKNHEEVGCNIAREVLPSYGYNMGQIDAVCGMIMATKVPQNPQNHLEEIICDADLDYLGRDDFEYIAATLYRELKENNLIANEQDWNRLQLKFLTAHKYFTNFGITLREPEKQKHIEYIRKIVESYET